MPLAAVGWNLPRGRPQIARSRRELELTKTLNKQAKRTPRSDARRFLLFITICQTFEICCLLNVGLGLNYAQIVEDFPAIDCALIPACLYSTRWAIC